MPLYKRKKKGKDGKLCELGNWYYVFWINQVRYKGSTKTDNEKAAEAIERRARVRAEDGEPIKPKRAPVLRDLILEFSKWVETINKAPKTIEDYLNGCRLILATPLSGMRADKITIDDIEATKFHESPYSTNSALRTLRRALRRAERKKELRDVPKIKLVDAPRRERVVSPGEEYRILAAIKYDDENRRYKNREASALHDVFTMMMDGCGRDSEIVAMRIENVYLDQGYYWNPKGKTKKARRQVPLSERVIAILRGRIGSRKEGWVFPSKRSKSGHTELSGLQHRFRRIARRLELPDDLKIYCGRHTCGTDIMAEAKDPRLVMDMLGHEELSTTMNYVHSDMARAKLLIDRRNELRQIKAGVPQVDLAAMPVQPGVN